MQCDSRRCHKCNLHELNHYIDTEIYLTQFSLYETSTNFYLLAHDTEETKFRLLKINRAIEKPKDLSEIVDDDQVNILLPPFYS